MDADEVPTWIGWLVAAALDLQVLCPGRESNRAGIADGCG